MLQFWNTLFSSSSFIPHGHCYLWQPNLVRLHVTSDTLIALAYYSIPITLFYFVTKREDLPFHKIFLLFATFIVACGTTHLLEVWTLWHPVYWLSGSVKAFTGIVSLVTAIELIPIIPKALALPSPTQLRVANEQLQAQIAERLKVEQELKKYQTQLEQIVTERTAQLEASKQQTEALLVREQEMRSQTEIARAEIQRYADRLTLALEAAQMGSWEWDLKTNQRYWSPRHEVIFGYESGQPERAFQDWAARLHPDDLPQVEETIQTALTNRASFRCEYRLILPNAETRWIYDLGRAEYNEQGQPIRMTGLILDITDRKRAEQELHARAEELSTLNATLAETTAKLQARNQELDQFAYVVSHDLKAPLRAIANLSTWIEEDLSGNLPDESQQHLDLLRRRVYRMEALIEGILEYSRVGRTEAAIATINVKDLLTEVIDSLSPPPTFSIELPPELPTFTTKRLLLSQVFSNLLSNAIKHHDRSDGQIRISCQQQDAYYEFTVSDDGPGIEPQYHQKIFTIFQTLKSRDTQENTGVGLSIVKKIIETEGGSISIESALGQGTTFRFTWLQQPKTANLSDLAIV